MATPTMVRNTAAGPTVFSDNNQRVEWAGANDPAGGDLRPVPESFLDSVQFQEMSARGILVVESADEAIQTALAAHRSEWDQRIERQRQSSIDALDEAPQNDSVVKTCLGPSGKGVDVLCGVDVPIKASKLAEIPPLCNAHSGMSNQFIASEGERIVQGKPEIVWMKIHKASTKRQDD